MNFKIILLCNFLLFSAKLYAEDFNRETLFEGINEQIHDYSCGSAALSILISGVFVDSDINEQKIIDEIFKLKEHDPKELGYSASEIAQASNALGYYAEWRKISPEYLNKINQPVILLIGLYSNSPHYVVLKGIENGEAFLADPMRGNIRIPYTDLINEGISEQIPKWYVMGIKLPKKITQDSNLYLHEDKYGKHATLEQSQIITLATVTKSNQVIANYNFSASTGAFNQGKFKVNTESFTHDFEFRYGVTENIEVGANIDDVESTQSFRLNGNRISNDIYRQSYRLYANNRYIFDENSEYGLIYGVNASFSEYASTWGSGVNVSAFASTSVAQFVLGTSLNKQFSHNDSYDKSLVDYQMTSYISMNKPLADRLLGSLSFYVNNGISKNTSIMNNTNTYYMIAPSMSYVFNEHFQFTPMFNYSFSGIENFSLGVSITYIGGW